MLRAKNRKRIITVCLISMIILFMTEGGSLLQAVTDDECYGAYEICMGEHGGWMPYPYSTPAVIYCGIGLIFCNLYM